MARNRKRAKERRSRHPTTKQVSRPGVATARAQREGREVERDELEVGRDELETERDGPDVEREGPDEPDALNETPSPIEHATPDAELADAQLALGRPELAREPESGEPEPEDFDDAVGPGDEEPIGGYDDGSDGGAGPGGGELAASGAPAPARRQVSGSRLINFLQGSWRELQRVQWPDRRQVMQATGVVIGFVIVAGVFLGVADEIAGKLVPLILK